MAKRRGETISLPAKTIEKLHTLLTEDLSKEEVFEFPVAVEEMSRSYAREDWEKLGNAVSFVLRAKDKAEQMKAVVDPHTGCRQLVLRLEPDPNAERSCAPLDWWVGWCEEWHPMGRMQKQKQYEFSFGKAGWRLYCTDENDDDTLLVRAEWDRPDDQNPQNAAQPHWHVHRQQKIGIPPTPLTAEQGENDLTDALILQDEGNPRSDQEVQDQAQDESLLTIPPDKWIEITDVHLGMAGWYNGDVHPECWQSPLGDIEQTLRKWAVATLQYMRTQLCYIRLPQTQGN